VDNLYIKVQTNTVKLQCKGGILMTKDSQPDNKKARMEKCNNQTPITEEGHNHNPNAKHKSIKDEGFKSKHFNRFGN
jgi:hypothetical protein